MWYLVDCQHNVDRFEQFMQCLKVEDFPWIDFTQYLKFKFEASDLKRFQVPTLKILKAALRSFDLTIHDDQVT